MQEYTHIMFDSSIFKSIYEDDHNKIKIITLMNKDGNRIRICRLNTYKLIVPSVESHLDFYATI